jgi:S1-C subfamily serine protease
MTVVDWVIVVFTVLLAVRGYSRGFVVSALTLIGFAAGALIGSRLGPALLTAGHHSPYAPLFSLGGGLLLGGAVAGLLEGVATRIRALMRIPGLRTADGLLGAGLTAAIALGLCWITGAVALQASGWVQFRHDIEASKILRTLDRLLPPSGPILGALARIDPLPPISGPSADVPPPDPRVLDAPGVARAAASVVRVTGTACGLGIEGSGWVAAPGEIVTNAHVVAGESDTTVQLRGVGPSLPAEVVVFDPRNDIAVLRVPGLGAPALTLADRPGSGLPGVILGFPEDGPFNAQAARIGTTEFTITQDAYGNGPVRREITALRGLVRPGNSGGPVVSPEGGQVLATVFAQVTAGGTPGPAGFAVPDAVVARELARARVARGPVSTQACAD